MFVCVCTVPGSVGFSACCIKELVQYRIVCCERLYDLVETEPCSESADEVAQCLQDLLKYGEELPVYLPRGGDV